MSSTQTVTVSSYPTLILTLKNKPPPDEHNEDKKKKNYLGSESGW